MDQIKIKWKLGVICLFIYFRPGCNLVFVQGLPAFLNGCVCSLCCSCSEPQVVTQRTAGFVLLHGLHVKLGFAYYYCHTGLFSRPLIWKSLLEVRYYSFLGTNRISFATTGLPPCASCVRQWTVELLLGNWPYLVYWCLSFRVKGWIWGY